MIAVDFPGTNITLGPPAGWTDEQCYTLKALKAHDEKGPCMITKWQPNKDDMIAIEAGRPIKVRFIIAWTFAELFCNHTTVMPQTQSMFVITVHPTQEQIKQIQEEGYFWMRTPGHSFSPVAMWTYNENMEVNNDY